MHKFVSPILGILLAVASCIAPSATAASLWWSKVITTQKTFAGCMREAQSGARRSLSDVRVSSDEVSGSSIDQQVYVAITCVERGAGQRAVAIIAGVGDNVNWVRQVVQNTGELVRTSGTPDF